MKLNEKEEDALLYFEKQISNMENSSGIIFNMPIISNEEIIKKDISNVKIMLGLIEKLQKEIETLEAILHGYQGLSNVIDIKQAELEKKEKIIDLMAEEFVSKTLMYSDKTKQEVREYFEKKVEG